MTVQSSPNWSYDRLVELEAELDADTSLDADTVAYLKLSLQDRFAKAWAAQKYR
jgi:hypothetical protein